MDLNKNKSATLGLIAILVVAGFFYFYHINQKGLFSYDEATFIMTGSTYAAVPRIFFDHILHPNISFQALATEYLPGVISFGTSARPMYIFLDTLGIFIFSRQDSAAFIANGIVGLGAIIILYFIAKSITKNHKFALLASFLLAISGYQIFYARAGLSQLLAGFLLLVGTLFYIRTFADGGDLQNKKTRDNLLLASFFWGLMFLAHYGTILILILIFIFEIASAVIFGKDYYNFIKRFLYLFVPILSIILIVDALGEFRNYLLTHIGYPYSSTTYISEILSQFGQVANFQHSEVKNPSFYLKMVTNFNGWLYLTLFLLSLLIFFYKKWWQSRPIFFLYYITYAAFIASSFIGLTVTRNLVITEGLISLVVAFAVYEIFLFAKNSYKLLFGVFFIILITIQLQQDWQIVNLKSSYRQAAQFLNSISAPSEDVYSEAWPILSFYLDKKVQILNRNPKTIYYVSDWEAVNQLHLGLSKKGRLIASFDNPAGNFLPLLGEANFEISDPTPGKTNIYEVKLH